MSIDLSPEKSSCLGPPRLSSVMSRHASCTNYRQNSFREWHVHAEEAMLGTDSNENRCSFAAYIAHLRVAGHTGLALGVRLVEGARNAMDGVRAKHSKLPLNVRLSTNPIRRVSEVILSLGPWSGTAFDRPPTALCTQGKEVLAHAGGATIDTGGAVSFAFSLSYHTCYLPLRSASSTFSASSSSSSASSSSYEDCS